MPSETFSVLTILFNTRRRLDNTRLRMTSSDEGFDEIEQAVSDIDERRDTLTRILAKENTKKFVDSNHKLVKTNEQMKKALADLANMQKTIDAITAMIGAVDDFIAAVTPG